MLSITKVFSLALGHLLALSLAWDLTLSRDNLLHLLLTETLMLSLTKALTTPN